MGKFQVWLLGLWAAAVSGACSASTAAFAAPQAFNFSHDGLIAFGKVFVGGGVIGVLFYLKQSPVPATSVTVTDTKTVTATKN